MRNRWLILAVLTFARAAMGFQFQSVAAVSPFLMDRLQMSYAVLGTLVGLYLVPGIAVALPGGVLAQRFGDRRVICLALAAMTLGGALMGMAENYAALSAGRLVSGAGAVVLNVLVTKMVTDWFQGREIVTALGILITSWPLGARLWHLCPFSDGSSVCPRKEYIDRCQDLGGPANLTRCAPRRSKGPVATALAQNGTAAALGWRSTSSLQRTRMVLRGNVHRCKAMFTR